MLSEVHGDSSAQASLAPSDKPHQQEVRVEKAPVGHASADGAQDATLLESANAQASPLDQNMVGVQSINSRSGQAASGRAASGVFTTGQQQACPQEALDDDMGELSGLGGVLQQWVNPAIPPPAAQPILNLKALGMAVPAAPISHEDLQQVDALFSNKRVRVHVFGSPPHPSPLPPGKGFEILQFIVFSQIAGGDCAFGTC